MTTNHPAHGPVSLDRLHQISEILSKAAAQSDGGNLGYAMADAVKVIDGAIASAGMEPYGYVHKDIYESCGTAGLSNDRDAYRNSDTHIALYAAQPAPLVPDNKSITQHFDTIALEVATEIMCDVNRRHEFLGGDVKLLSRIQSRIDEACLAAMLQAGNSPVTPDGWIPVSDRMPERDVDVQVYCADKKEQMVGYMERNEKEGWFRFASLPNGGGVYCKPTHWMPLPAAPKQEVN